jgi:hypothetical protein
LLGERGRVLAGGPEDACAVGRAFTGPLQAVELIADWNGEEWLTF